MIFCPFTPSPTENPKNQDFKKLKKIAGEIIISHLFTKNHYHMRHGSWDTGWHRQVLVIWAIFCPFTPLTIKNLKNQNFEKMRCHHFAHVYQISQSYDACFLRHGAQQTEFLFFSGQFFLPLYPNKNLKNQNFEKMKKATTATKKNTWRYHPFTLVYHKRKPCNVWFLRSRAWQTEFFVILDYFLHFYPPNPEN